MSTGTLRVLVEDVTPQLAAHWLSMQRGNRKLRPRKVDRIVGLIRGERWYPGIGAIVFDEDGVMIDGQHRLTAVIEAGQPVTMIVVRNVHRDAKYWLDTGTGRTGSDALEMAGVESNQATLATALSLLLRYERSGKVGGAWLPENEDLRDAVLRFPDMTDSVEATKAARTNAIWGSHGTFAFLHYLLSRQDSIAADTFFRGVLSGLGVQSEGDPRHLLRTRLQDETTRKSKIRHEYVIALCFKAWNVYRAGEERTHLRVRQRGDASEGLPDIGDVPGIRAGDRASRQ